MKARRRAGDQGSARAARRTIKVSAVLFVVGFVVFAVASLLVIQEGVARDREAAARDRQLSALVARINREGVERRDQTCALFESDHLDDVKRLRRTYAYLSRPARKRDPELTELGLRQLPEIEDEARMDTAPDYCDEPGVEAERKGASPVGLPEPDPKLPRWRDFSHLRKR